MSDKCPWCGAEFTVLLREPGGKRYACGSNVGDSRAVAWRRSIACCERQIGRMLPVIDAMEEWRNHVMSSVNLCAVYDEYKEALGDA